MTIGERIKARRLEIRMSQEELANKLGYKSRSSINKIELNQQGLRQSKIKAIADALDTTPAYIMGWSEESSGVAPASNMVPLETMDRIPMVGTIACGVPILAEQNIEDYVDLPKHIKADFALTCQGDSMIEAGIQNGDIVYIRQQSAVDNGQIAAVLVDGSEATLKRFYLDSSSRTVTLMAANQAYAPIVRTGEDVGQVKVLGLAVAYTHPLV